MTDHYKHVANTLTDILSNTNVQRIQDRRTDLLTDVIPQVEDYWGYDLYTRKPGPAYKDGIFVGTDLDLACFLYALVDRKAVIILPRYKAMRAKSTTEGEHIVSKENRHGQILSLVSNKETFVFSVQIKDMNVMTTDSVGAFRNFSITKFDGSWYEGWDRIEFLASAQENDFVTKNDMWSGNSVIFKHFVSPNRWTSFYGQYYFITKALVTRLKEEASHWRAVIKDMETNGIKWPPSGDGAKHEWPKTSTGESKPIKVSAFEVELDLPERIGTWPEYEQNTDNMVALRDRVDRFNKSVTKLQFMLRCTELSLFKQGDSNLPGWIRNAEWEREYVQPGMRKKWDRLILFQPKVGQVGVSLRKRIWEKTERVAPSF